MILTPEEIKSVKPKPSRYIQIGEFLPVGEIVHQWYERPYYLGPNGDDSSYFALAKQAKVVDLVELLKQALEKTDGNQREAA